MYIERKIEQQLSYLSEHFPAVVIAGARQTGKTTLIKNLIGVKEGMTYVTLDYPRIRELARSDPELFLQQYPAPVIIDEVQYAPELLPYIKIRIDENRQNGQYFLTGSQMFRLMKNVSESLAGQRFTERRKCLSSPPTNCAPSMMRRLPRYSTTSSEEVCRRW